ncbi:MAG: hypothetical protein JXA68_04335 [Ignavibacteriales bacterium]|nr:hypothetical protein [Ignavibacteriales bacterium]
MENIRQTVDENGTIISAQDYSTGVYPDAKQIGREIVRSYNNAERSII